ncbi:MAG: IS21-like element helper ATPase IstB [Pseudobdellovibrionaceae bacterium]
MDLTITTKEREQKMLMEQTAEKMQEMRLKKMAEKFLERIQAKHHEDMEVEDFIGLLVDDEYQCRLNRRLQDRLTKAKFKESQASLERVDYQFKRDLQKKTVLELAANQWIRRKQNIILTGPSGVGKSFLAQALGHHACREGYWVRYYRCTKFYQTLLTSRADGSYLAFLKTIQKSHVIILDDFGLAALSDEIKNDLFEIIEDRNGQASTIITSQLPTEKWHSYLGGGMIGDAFCDRVLHNAHKVGLKGESYRKETAKLT